MPFSSGRLITNDPSVRKHGSSTTISFASPVCNTDGPSVSVDSFGEQSEVVAVVVVDAAADDDDDVPPERSGTVNVPPLTITLLVCGCDWDCVGVGAGVVGV
jgi:hypothetical protein